MKLNFLGTGTSTGVPEIGCRCKVCQSVDPKDKRLRASALIHIDTKQLLIDCGPDFRQQILPENFAKMDGVLLTHEHYDHVGGLDDLRPFCKFSDVDVFTNDITLNSLKKRMPYCFADKLYPGVPAFNFNLVRENHPFHIGHIEIVPIQVMHYKLPLLGYRIGNMAYLTDVKYIPEESFAQLHNLDVLVMSALRTQEHLSHQTLDEALANVRRIAPKKTYLIHMSHDMGLHEEVQAQLPKDVFLAYDGLEISF